MDNLTPPFGGKPSDGSVYVLVNAAMPGLVKVGCTGRTPALRARELSTTGVPLPFIVAWSAPVKDYAACEKLVHLRLDRYRTNAAREFFRCDVSTASREVRKAAAGLLRPRWWRLLHWRPLLRGRASRRLSKRRGSADGLAVSALILGVFGGVVWFKPHPPAFLPPSVARAVWLLEALPVR